MKKIIGLFLSIILLGSCVDKKPSGDNKQNEAIISKYFEYFNNHNWEALAKMYSSNAQFRDPSLGPGIVKQSNKQVAEKYKKLSEMFPDVNDKVVKVYYSGEKDVIVEFISTGTAPDGAKFQLPICTIFSIENGLIIKDLTYYDNF